MKKIILTFLFSALSLALLATTSFADVNINLLNLSSPERDQLQQTYSNAYGYPVEQIAPVMMAPPTEVPAILQIAKTATTLPVAIWGLRKMGFSYMDILNMYTLPPATLFVPEVPYERYGPPMGEAYGYYQKYGNKWPKTVVLADPVLIQLGQIGLFTNRLKIPTISMLTLPSDPLVFQRVVLRPYDHPTYFLPPGQAKKMGLWMPPGQAKKHWKYYDHDDDDHGKWKVKGGKGKGKWKD